jgi:hypothetical protein
MKPGKAVYFLLLISTGLISCSANISKQEKESPQQHKETFAPGTVSIMGRIVSIDSARMVPNPQEPCGKFPCWAKIKVESIVGYGAGAPPVSRNDTLETKFAFTLSPTTKDLFPNLKVRMPGLKEGSEFSASIHILNSRNFDNKTFKNEYIIYTYSKKD